MKSNTWQPTSVEIQKTNIFKAMKKLGFETYPDFWKWSVDRRESFWEFVIDTLEIPFDQKPSQILDVSNGITQPNWLKDSKFNITDACFTAPPTSIAIIYQKEGGKIERCTYSDLEKLVNRIAHSFQKFDLKKGDVIAINMIMNVEAIAIYLAGIKAGLAVATIADSFTPQEINVRIGITQPKLVFTQDFIERNGKKLPLYDKVCQANAPKTVVLSTPDTTISLRKNDINWKDFLSENSEFTSVKCHPDAISTILFSSGTTSEPKAIPWTHTTPIKCASDGYFHQDIQENEVIAWPTNLGWMMGPWLVFAALINKASIALYGGAPLGRDFGEFVQNAQVNMLGVVPSIVKQWIDSKCMEGLNWNAIKCFSSTGEASNPADYTYLMLLAGNKPIIEYCGGTEIGGGYICSTLAQSNIPSSFSTKALGTDFVLLDENHRENRIGEVFIIPPTLGLSNTLLNKNHHEVYYEGIEPYQGKILRRHGDQLELLENGYFKAQGRIDDAMNLGGIKVSSIQIEELVNTLEFVKESAAVSVPPKEGGPEKLLIFYVGSQEISRENAFIEISQLVKTKLNPLFKVFDVVCLEKLPRTASGKIMRRELRKEYQTKK